MTIDHDRSAEHYQQLADLAENARQDQLAEESYADMLLHPETVVDAFDLFSPRTLAERDAEIAWELQEARTMVMAGNAETAITDRLDRALELLSRDR